LYYAGHLKNSALVASIGLSNVIMSTTVAPTIRALNSSLETLVSQAVGSRCYDECAIYLNRGSILVVLAIMSYMIIFYLSHDAFQYLSTDQEVVENTQKYLIYYLPGYMMYGLSDLNRKYLNSFSQNFVPMVCFTMATSLHPFWTSHLSFQYGISGIALSSLITNTITFILLKIFMKFIKPLEWIPLTDLRNFDFKEYILLGIPYFFIQFLDYWAWEQMTLTAGLISVDAQVSQVLLLNLLEFTYMFGSGLQTTACTLIGNRVGNGEITEAKEFF
jgi:Na+-driven multidrug efflux pump